MNENVKNTYEAYMNPILDMNLDGFTYDADEGYYYTVINDLKVSIHFDLDDMTYNIVTTDTKDKKVITWDWNPNMKNVYRILLQHIQDVYTKFTK